MTVNVFLPSPAPSPGTSVKTKTKLLKADFGEGYTQTAADGTNYEKRTAILTWDVLLPSESDAIENFFRAQGGFAPFYYTLSDSGFASRWTCEEWDVTRDRGGIRKLTANLIEYFGVLT